MQKPLSGKVAMVTGGTRGIGASIAHRLATDGANIAFTYGKSQQSAEQLTARLSTLGVKAQAYHADANMPNTLAATAQQVVKAFGGVDILVNNAGVFATGMVGDLTPTDYESVFNVNVHAVFSLTNALVPHMKPGSRIINISSVLGERASGAGMSVYNASKFAVTGFSRSWAKDLGSKGILVNAVQPGPIATDMNPDDGEFAEYMKSQTALGRYGKADEVAAAVAFLAGPDASYITGATLNVDGGWNA